MKDVAHVTIRRCPTCNNIREHTAHVREMLRGDPTVPVQIEDGAKGEFTVLINGRVVAKTQPDGTLPTEALILDAVRQAEPAESSKMGNDRCSNTLTPNRTWALGNPLAKGDAMKMVLIRQCPIWGSIRKYAARVAESLRALPQTAVALENGDQGEFTVLVNGQVVARKTDDGLPSEGEILDAVRRAPQAAVPAE